MKEALLLGSYLLRSKLEVVLSLKDLSLHYSQKTVCAGVKASLATQDCLSERSNDSITLDTFEFTFIILSFGKIVKLQLYPTGRCTLPKAEFCGKLSARYSEQPNNVHLTHCVFGVVRFVCYT